VEKRAVEATFLTLDLGEKIRQEILENEAVENVNDSSEFNNISGRGMQQS
jgi:hypothetical protein